MAPVSWSRICLFTLLVVSFFLGNFNLVYAIIRKRSTFHHLANLPCDTSSIQKALQRRKKSGVSRPRSLSASSLSSTGSSPVSPAGPGSLKASLEATPGGKLKKCQKSMSFQGQSVAYWTTPGAGEQESKSCSLLHPPGIDKITEKAQVSQDGTMVAVPRSGSQAGASDTESNSERDVEVTLTTTFLSLCWQERENKAESLPTSFIPGAVRGSQESLGQRLVNSRSLERRSRVGQSASLVLGLVLCVCLRLCLQPSALLSPGDVLEDQASPADHHETAAGAGASSGEDMY